MLRNLKILGLAMSAILAMSAVWAMSAQAANPELHCTSTTNTCIATASERTTHTFNVAGGNVRCRSRLTATLNAKTVSSVSSVAAEYTSCRAFGVAANVNMEGCSYTLNNVAASSPATANFNIVCPEGRTIRISAASIPCTITIYAVTGLPHILFSNNGPEPTDVNIVFTISGVRYIEHEPTCPSPGTHNDGTLIGESTLEAFNDNGGLIEGTKVGLHVGLF